MGKYYRTVPKNIALILKDKYYFDIFVETGTYTGLSSKWAAKHFFQVHTIEKDPDYFIAAESRLLPFTNVFMYMNDSQLILPEIMQFIGEHHGAIFYLDAHWRPGYHYGRPIPETSALNEVELINQWENDAHVIIVDDASRFGTDNWPSRRAIIDALQNNGMRFVEECLDTFVAVPSKNFTKRSYYYSYASAHAPSTSYVSVGGIWD